jgi:ABC-type transport system involved in cytochrome bd biosynthesis fused ATPase/permease subunit
MDITFLPMRAVFIVICILGALIGAIYWRKTSKILGATVGTIAALAILAILMAIAPVKLTTNTKAYTATQTQAATNLANARAATVNTDKQLN